MSKQIGLSYRQLEQQVLNEASPTWESLPPGLDHTNVLLKALEQKGLVETRVHWINGWEWRRAPVDPHANGCPDSPGMCECFRR